MTTSNKSLIILKPFSRVLAATTIAVGIASIGAVGASMLHTNQANAELVSVVAPQTPSFADVVEAVSPAVVSVRVEAKLQPASDHGDFRFDRRFGEGQDRFREFFRDRGRGQEFGFGRPDRRGENRNNRQRPRRRFGMSQGSGFFVSGDGYIVTNHHVIENGAKFTIVMNDGTEMEASLVGADARTDLAVLKVEKADKEYTYVEFATKPSRVGDWVVAVGNPFGLGGTVTAGIISANGRDLARRQYDDFIQIDAAVNKGNSGGPTFNLSGQVIGVNTAIFSPSGGNVGIAFAIPAKTASVIVEDLIDDGHVVRGWLGVRIQPVSKDIAESVGLELAKGAIVTDPQPDSPAEKAGIRSGDIITAVDGNSIKGPKQLAKMIGSFTPDSKVNLSIWRDGKAMDIAVTLGKLAGPKTFAAAAAPDLNALATLGLELESAPDGAGVIVTEVEPGSGAARKGMKTGDIIASENGEDVTRPQDVVKVVKEASDLGRKAALFQVKRGDSSTFIAVPITKG
ncbi:MAG: Do family serine endopeptidase [Rhizobiaceae bacterium]|nr:Do family serine endopeptidase [Rhizobiaceae bacterium]